MISNSYPSDTGVLTLSQYILLDTPLLFFIMAAAFCLLMFQEYHKKYAHVTRENMQSQSIHFQTV